MTHRSVAEREAAALCSTYRRLPVTLIRGTGSFVETDDGRALLDLVGGIAVNVLGHCHPAVVAAATAQLSRLSHASNLYYTEPQLELAEALIGSAFPGRVFLCNSGAEANEIAIKVARKWGQLHRQGAYTIVTLEGAFHGRTLATLAATGNPHYSDPFRPLPEGFRQVPRGDLEAVERALADPDRPAVAVLAEPIQGRAEFIRSAMTISAGFESYATATTLCSCWMKFKRGWAGRERCGRTSQRGSAPM